MKRSLLTIAVALAVATITAISAGVGASSTPSVPLGSIPAQMPQAEPCDLMHSMLGDWRVSGWMMGMDQQKYEVIGTATRRLVPGTVNTVKESVKATVGGKPNTWNAIYTLNAHLGHYQHCSWGMGADYLGTVEGKRAEVEASTDEEGNEVAGPSKIEFHGVGWEGSTMDYASTITFHPTARDKEGNPVDRHGMGWEVHASRMKFTPDMPWMPHSEVTYRPIHEGVIEGSDAVNAARMGHSRPGEHHGEMLKSAGEWNVVMSIPPEWTGAPEAMEHHGTASIKSIVDGLFIEETMVIKFPPAEDGTEYPPMELRMWMGFNNGTKEFELSLLGNHSSSIDNYRGKYDPEHEALVLHGKMYEPTHGMFTDVRVLASHSGPDSQRTVIQHYIAGKWVTVATVTYARAEGKKE